jgi:hypothetical protein
MSNLSGNPSQATSGDSHSSEGKLQSGSETSLVMNSDAETSRSGTILARPSSTSSSATSSARAEPLPAEPDNSPGRLDAQQAPASGNGELSPEPAEYSLWQRIQKQFTKDRLSTAVTCLSLAVGVSYFVFNFLLAKDSLAVSKHSADVSEKAFKMTFGKDCHDRLVSD